MFVFLIGFPCSIRPHPLSQTCRIPKFFAKPITMVQILQMILGFSACTYGAVKCSENNLSQHYFNVVGALMYISYGFLFAQMFSAKYAKEAKAKGAGKKAE